MFRSAIVTVVLAGAGLFGYYFVTDRTDRPAGEKARSAAGQVGDLAKDTGAGMVVQARLTARYGVDATRFIHTHYDDGAVVVYGLAPVEMKADEVAEIIKAVPGVKSVDVRIGERPLAMSPQPG
ncbi:MAG: BON domain-containing protein [Phycisphaerae bacterium]